MKLTQATFANMVESVAINPHDTIREMDQLIEDAKKDVYKRQAWSLNISSPFVWCLCMRYTITPS